jgi:CBS domain containing-hemolysin-like protein
MIRPPSLSHDHSEENHPTWSLRSTLWRRYITPWLKGDTSSSLRKEISLLLEKTGTEDEFSPPERLILKNVLLLHERRVDDVMVPRADIVAISIDVSLGDTFRAFQSAGHSRLPVYSELLDDPRGIIHIRDFFDAISTRCHTEAGQKERFSLDLTEPLRTLNIIRPLLFVPASMPVLDLLLKMQATHLHMALVVDEYGGTDGLVSIEDLVEIIVGDIEDEHDDREPQLIINLKEGNSPSDAFIIDARADLETVSHTLGVPLEASDDIDTFGGFVVMVAGRVPVRGEIIALTNTLETEVLDADPRRLKRLRVYRRSSLTSRSGQQERTTAATKPMASETSLSHLHETRPQS